MPASARLIANAIEVIFFTRLYHYYVIFLSSGGWGKIKLKFTTLPRFTRHMYEKCVEVW